MKKNLSLHILLTAIWLFSFHNVYAMESSQHYPLSMAASQQAVSHWLDMDDQSYRIIPQSGGLIHISSSKNNEQWQIKLTPHSPLATTISIRIENDEDDELRIQELQQYLNSRNKNNKQITNQQPEIPSPVLEKIGTVACLRADRQGKTVQFSGVTIDEQGLILCTAHDLKEQEEVTIVSTINTLFKGDIIKIDFERDLALIQIQSGREQVINIEEGRNLLSMGEKLYSIGCPVGLRGTVNSGYINGPPRLVNKQPMWQASMEIQPGSSGSPVFDNEGKFVAIVKGRHRVSEGIGFLIPLEVIIDFLSEQLK